ncbi:MAG: hypothetical protein M5U28_24975 [Sandaracinaceae bacterium]|nr:hypothetical protein [Sandaracinaceae bacterium]
MGDGRGRRRGRSTRASPIPSLARHGFQHSDLRLARPIERRSFRNIGQLVDRGVLVESTNWTQLYVPARVHDQVRLVATRQDDVVAHLSVLRKRGHAAFSTPPPRASSSRSSSPCAAP